jgi:hypothetical protein
LPNFLNFQLKLVSHSADHATFSLAVQNFRFLWIAAIQADGAEEQVAEVGVDELGFVADFQVAQVFAGAGEEFGRVGEF